MINVEDLKKNMQHSELLRPFLVFCIVKQKYL